ncbi:MAG: hypothetical protein ACJ75H_17460 [Thermoanaerobaculia bacterium]
MSRKLFGLALFALALVFVLSAAPASADQNPAAPAPALAPLASPAPTAGVCSATPAVQNPEPEFMASKRLGYCHCGCSSVRTCRDSSDCGGASCDQAISCC